MPSDDGGLERCAIGSKVDRRSGGEAFSMSRIETLRARGEAVFVAPASDPDVDQALTRAGFSVTLRDSDATTLADLILCPPPLVVVDVAGRDDEVSFEILNRLRQLGSEGS